jgi:hypothetical protein
MSSDNIYFFIIKIQGSFNIYTRIINYLNVQEYNEVLILTESMVVVGTDRG